MSKRLGIGCYAIWKESLVISNRVINLDILTQPVILEAEWFGYSSPLECR